MEPNVKLEHEVEGKWLLAFALPTIVSTIIMNIYTSVDGVFVARLVNTDALSAINITMPLIYLTSALGTMFGTGGNALIARKIGEGHEQEAREDFSLLLVVALLSSIVLAGLALVFLNPLCRMLGSDDALLPYCRAYMVPVLISIPFSIFGTVFQLSYITVGKANFGLIFSILSGILNIGLDWLFIHGFGWGIAGAAIATALAYCVPSIIGLFWFLLNHKQVLYLVRPKWRPRSIWNSCSNGASEMVSVLAFSVVTVLFNNTLMSLAGSDGVASLSIIWYAQGLFGGLFRGYINGIASVVSYNFGRGDKARLGKLLSISVKTLGITAIVVTAGSFLLGHYVVGIFAGSNAVVQAMSLHGFRIVAVSFLMMAFNVFSSGWFTALNDGRTSAILSFCRTIIFMVLPVLILPRILGTDGVWLSMSVGEGMSLIMTLYYFHKFKSVWTAARN